MIYQQGIRVFSTITTAALMLGLLVGCGGGESGGETLPMEIPKWEESSVAVEVHSKKFAKNETPNVTLNYLGEIMEIMADLEKVSNVNLSLKRLSGDGAIVFKLEWTGDANGFDKANAVYDQNHLDPIGVY